MDDLRADPLLARSTEVQGFKVLPPCVLFSRIGVGGMGAVYGGHHLNLDIEVAVKCLKPSLAEDDPTFVERFRREARAAARINHQNVVRVFDVAESMGLHYLIMEYVQGETARQRVDRKGPLDVPEALEIVYEASLGLGEAHRTGLVHRDIKPDNLLISSRGQVKVADLGLAKPTIGSGTSMLSMAGQVMGTPPYMPPEQWGEGTVTGATDVWAMGAVLYFLLTSQEAIRGDSLANVMSKIVLQPFPDVRDFRQDVPDSVAELLRKATAKEPGERFLDAAELASAIAALPEHRISLVDTGAGTTELRTMLSPPPMPQIEEIKQLLRQGQTTRKQATPGDAPETKPTPARRRSPAAAGGRRGGQLAWIAAAALVLGAGGALAYRQWGGEPQQQPDPARDPDPRPAAPTPPTAAQLEASLRREAVAPVERGQPSRFAGVFTAEVPDGLRLGDAEVRLAADGSFAQELVVDGDALAVTAIVAGVELALAPFDVTFTAPPKPALVFRDELGTEPGLLDGGITGERALTILGRASQGDVPVYVDGALVEDVRWRRETFRFSYELPNEGRNRVVVALGAADGDARALEIVRLTAPPTLTPRAPATLTSSTDATELVFEVGGDEWTTAVVARYGGASREALTRRDDGVWVTPRPIPLEDGANTIKVIGQNATGKPRELAFTVTSTAPLPRLGDVFVDGRVVTGEGRVFVSAPPTVRVALAADTTLIVDGASQPATFAAPIAEGAQRELSLRAARGARRSEPRTITIVHDGTKPTLDAKAAAAAQPGADVVITGTWRDRFGIATMAIDGGGAVTTSDKRAASGTWRLTTKAGARSSKLTVIATDNAGNEQRLTVDVPVVAPAPVEPDPQPVKPVVDAPAAKTFDGFEPVAGSGVDALGYPRELRHVGTGIELVAVPATGKPSFYVAARVTSNREWDGAGDGEAVGSLTWLDVAARLETPRFDRLALPTKDEWARIRAANDARIVTGGRREWLAMSTDEAFDERPLFDGTKVRAAKANFSDGYTGFRVVFRAP